ncbi:FHA domain-containing protein [Leifsonia sp. LS-T14]|uniref:FHA domain-containing protein n=1 Tax=unclassified Leifsonia TaxID=2663824 RepID=UPI0035A61C7B
MDDSGFIVPPPGLIPSRPPLGAPGSDEPADRSSAPIRPLPVFTPPAAPGGAPAAPRPVWRLILPGGRSIPVTRTVLVGRNPSRAAAATEAADAELIALDDPTSTVSKTHAELRTDGDLLTVTDLHSTNGVLVGGARAEPGSPAPVGEGMEILLGDLRVRVERS